MKRFKYLLKAHAIYAARKKRLIEEVKQLKADLNNKAFKEHPTVKLARRILEADQNIIPQDPNKREYQLRGYLSKYRRYKQGLQRYRLFFCFSDRPIAIIIYLYLNDNKSLRKEGSKTDPYVIFKKYLRKGTISNDPQDPRIKGWVQRFQ